VRSRRWARLVATIGLTVPALLGAGCAGGGGSAADDVLVLVSAPLTRAPWVAESIENGARLAADRINDAGGIDVGGTRRRIRLDVKDNALSPQTALAHAREAVNRGAALLLTDGTGAVAVSEVTDAADLPVMVLYEGGTSLVDEDERPTLFRLAPANRPMTRRLADYLAEKSPKVALLTDDSTYGKDGRAEMREAMARNRTPVVADVDVPVGAADLAPQVRRARASGATALVVWARAPVVAAAVRAARSADWEVPVYTSPSGEDPLVRQQLADRPEWVDGLTFVSFRITAEIGPEPWERFRAAYEERFGEEQVGVSARGRPVVQPPDWAMYPHDALDLLKAALERSDAPGRPLLAALNTVSIVGANGDERSFGPQNHEGVSQDDMYLAVFRDLRFQPVEDDLLSSNLPPVPQG
jgi:ABC-type branched-subunit amino acid transport system substrate-binding protein